MTEIEFDRQLAARVAARAEIRDIRLFEASLTLANFPSGDIPLRYSLAMDPGVDHEPGDARFVVRTKYVLEIAVADEAPAPGDSNAVASVAFELGALFDLDSRAPDTALRDDELQAFARSTGQMALWPFAREYIFDVSGRMGLPPLTIGVFRMPLSASEVDDANSIDSSGV